MLFEIKEEIKEYIKNNKDNLKPNVVLRLTKDTILEMLSYNIPKKTILQHINKQLQTNINYYTFVSFVKRLSSYQSNKTNKFNKSNAKPNNFKKDSFNPFEALKGLN